MENNKDKKSLLKEIESLISYGDREFEIAPSLLEYLSVEELQNIILSLKKRVNRLDSEDIEWLKQFGKE